jgi:alpha-beta hydrolase superfamily lysophospholipase
MSKGWRLVVLEFPGHGRSEGKRAVCADFHRTVEIAAHFVQHVRQEQGLRFPQTSVPFVLCGHSFGGTVAAYCADR